MIFIIEIEDMRKLLLDRGDAARVLAGDDIDELLRKSQLFFVYDHTVPDDVDGDVMINETKYVQIELIDRAFYFNNVFFAHLVAVRIFDDRNAAVHFVQSQVFIDRHALSSLDMVEYNTFI